MRLTVAALLASSLLPVQSAHASGLVIVLYDGEAHLTTHRCNTLDKVLEVPSTCGSTKNAPSSFSFGASEAKKPKKSGNLTRCFALKVPIAGKTYGPLGPRCDIHVAGTTGKKTLPVVGGNNPLGTCDNSTGPLTGIFAIYESHAGPKKVSYMFGVFEIKFGFAKTFGFKKKKGKAQGGDFNGMFKVGAQGLTKGNTDTLDDCYLAAINGKDDPQQLRITGFHIEIQVDQ